MYTQEQKAVFSVWNYASDPQPLNSLTRFLYQQIHNSAATPLLSPSGLHTSLTLYTVSLFHYLSPSSFIQTLPYFSHSGTGPRVHPPGSRRTSKRKALTNRNAAVLCDYEVRCAPFRGDRDVQTDLHLSARHKRSA
jgi:hypothetical protein